jgi:hypothetical protein
MAFSRFLLNDFEKKGGGGGPVALQFFGYLKRALKLLILLVINIHNLRINLDNELQYSYIFITYIRGVQPLVNTSLFMLKFEF